MPRGHRHGDTFRGRVKTSHLYKARQKTNIIYTCICIYHIYNYLNVLFKFYTCIHIFSYLFHILFFIFLSRCSQCLGAHHALRQCGAALQLPLREFLTWKDLVSLHTTSPSLPPAGLLAMPYAFSLARCRDVKM